MHSSISSRRRASSAVPASASLAGRSKQFRPSERTGLAPPQAFGVSSNENHPPFSFQQSQPQYQHHPTAAAVDQLQFVTRGCDVNLKTITEELRGVCMEDLVPQIRQQFDGDLQWMRETWLAGARARLAPLVLAGRPAVQQLMQLQQQQEKEAERLRQQQVGSRQADSLVVDEQLELPGDQEEQQVPIGLAEPPADSASTVAESQTPHQPAAVAVVENIQDESAAQLFGDDEPREHKWSVGDVVEIRLVKHMVTGTVIEIQEKPETKRKGTKRTKAPAAADPEDAGNMVTMSVDLRRGDVCVPCHCAIALTLLTN